MDGPTTDYSVNHLQIVGVEHGEDSLDITSIALDGHCITLGERDGNLKRFEFPADLLGKTPVLSPIVSFDTGASRAIVGLHAFPTQDRLLVCTEVDQHSSYFKVSSRCLSDLKPVQQTIGKLTDDCLALACDAATGHAAVLTDDDIKILQLVKTRGFKSSFEFTLVKAVPLAGRDGGPTFTNVQKLALVGDNVYFSASQDGRPGYFALSWTARDRAVPGAVVQVSTFTSHAYLAPVSRRDLWTFIDDEFATISTIRDGMAEPQPISESLALSRLDHCKDLPVSLVSGGLVGVFKPEAPPAADDVATPPRPRHSLLAHLSFSMLSAGPSLVDLPVPPTGLVTPPLTLPEAFTPYTPTPLTRPGVAVLAALHTPQAVFAVTRTSTADQVHRMLKGLLLAARTDPEAALNTLEAAVSVLEHAAAEAWVDPSTADELRAFIGLHFLPLGSMERGFDLLGRGAVPPAALVDLMSVGPTLTHGGWDDCPAVPDMFRSRDILTMGGGGFTSRDPEVARQIVKLIKRTQSWLPTSIGGGSGDVGDDPVRRMMVREQFIKSIEIGKTEKYARRLIPQYRADIAFDGDDDSYVIAELTAMKRADLLGDLLHGLDTRRALDCWCAALDDSTVPLVMAELRRCGVEVDSVWPQLMVVSGKYPVKVAEFLYGKRVSIATVAARLTQLTPATVEHYIALVKRGEARETRSAAEVGERLARDPRNMRALVGRMAAVMRVGREALERHRDGGEGEVGQVDWFVPEADRVLAQLFRSRVLEGMWPELRASGHQLVKDIEAAAAPMTGVAVPTLALMELYRRTSDYQKLIGRYTSAGDIQKAIRYCMQAGTEKKMNERIKYLIRSFNGVVTRDQWVANLRLVLEAHPRLPLPGALDLLAGDAFTVAEVQGYLTTHLRARIEEARSMKALASFKRSEYRLAVQQQIAAAAPSLVVDTDGTLCARCGRVLNTIMVVHDPSTDSVYHELCWGEVCDEVAAEKKHADKKVVDLAF